MRMLFMGTPAPVIPVLERLCQMDGAGVVAVVTPPDRERGRGRRSEPPPVKDAALRLGVPVLQPDSLRSKAAQAELAALSPDVIVVAAYGKLLPKPVLELPPHGCLNLHPSLLPLHRGPSPVAAAILEGDEVTGISLMLLDEGMDTGPVIAQREYSLVGTETASELTSTLLCKGADLLAETLVPWARGQLQAQSQDGSRATVSRKLERADGLADWTLPAETLARQCRAYTPWPGLYTHWEGKTLKLLRVSALPGDGRRSEPGQVVAEGPSVNAAVVTGGGLVGLSAVQLEGRRPVTIGEFLAGYPNFIGACLG